MLLPVTPQHISTKFLSKLAGLDSAIPNQG